MTEEQLRKEIKEFLKNKPKGWRDGQAIFNYIDNAYGVAREVQMIRGVDCFYNDDNINEFIEVCAQVIDNYENL